VTPTRIRSHRFVILALAASLLSPALLGVAYGQEADPMVQMVADLLGDSDRDMRALGLQQVREGVPGEAATRQFTAMLDELPVEAQAGLIQALGDRGDPTALPAIRQRAASDNARLSAAALSALGALGKLPDIPLLAAKAAEQDAPAPVRAAARGSLVRLRGEQTGAAMIAALDQLPAPSQAVLLDVLAKRGSRDALPKILDALDAEDVAVRLAALRALRVLGEATHTAAVVDALKAADDANQRRAAELTLLTIGSRAGSDASDAIAAGLTDANRPARMALMHAVARAGGLAAVEALVAQIDADEPAVQDQAVRMLSVSGEPAAAEHLERLATSAENPRHKFLAIRGLLRTGKGDVEKLTEALDVARAAARAQLGEPAEPGEAEISLSMEPIDLELPAPAFRGTPVPLKEPNVEKPRGAPRPPFLAPAGTVNLALGKPVTASDPRPTAGELDFVTDGDKEASDFGYLELAPGTQWVQVDLEQRATIFAVLVWHNHAEARVYRDVIVQVSDDPDFLQATTVFNNDYDNSAGLGKGDDLGYVETAEGKLIDAGGVEGRYIRLYSSGDNVDGKNQYTEVSVYGLPMK